MDVYFAAENYHHDITVATIQLIGSLIFSIQSETTFLYSIDSVDEPTSGADPSTNQSMSGTGRH